jgi:hypothetical protein
MQAADGDEPDLASRFTKEAKTSRNPWAADPFGVYGSGNAEIG